MYGDGGIRELRAQVQGEMLNYCFFWGGVTPLHSGKFWFAFKETDARIGPVVCLQ